MIRLAGLRPPMRKVLGLFLNQQPDCPLSGRKLHTLFRLPQGVTRAKLEVVNRDKPVLDVPLVRDQLVVKLLPRLRTATRQGFAGHEFTFHSVGQPEPDGVKGE